LYIAIAFAGSAILFQGCLGDDLTNPVITLLGDDVIEIKINDPAGFVDPGFTASDDEDGDITSRVVVGGDVVDVDKIGTYEILYTVKDDAGNQTTVKRTVHIVATLDFIDRSLYIGSWDAEEEVTVVGSTDPPSVFQFVAGITSSINDSVILVENFGGFGATFTVSMKLTDKFGEFDIPSQPMTGSGYTGTLEGTASTEADGKGIILEYDIYYTDGTQESVTGVYDKK
jgi:hypothetical protein